MVGEGGCGRAGARAPFPLRRWSRLLFPFRPIPPPPSVLVLAAPGVVLSAHGAPPLLLASHARNTAQPSRSTVYGRLEQTRRPRRVCGSCRVAVLRLRLFAQASTQSHGVNCSSGKTCELPGGCQSADHRRRTCALSCAAPPPQTCTHTHTDGTRRSSMTTTRGTLLSPSPPSLLILAPLSQRVSVHKPQISPPPQPPPSSAPPPQLQPDPAAARQTQHSTQALHLRTPPRLPFAPPSCRSLFSCSVFT